MDRSRLLLYARTLRHLRPIQITTRIRRKLRNPAPSLAPAPILRPAMPGGWAETPHRPPVMVGPQTFRFLNETHAVEAPEDWNFASDQKVSRYNLHYFDDLCAQGAADRKAWHEAIISRWIADNPVGSAPGWESYPASLRIVNWIKWHLSGNTLSQQAIESLAVQVRYLSERIETELMANHVLANAKALAFAGLFFGGSEGDRWRDTGMATLQQEFAEEILADGGHYERSPMYHSIILEDVLDVINLGRAYPNAIGPRWQAFARSWADYANRMRGWLKAMIHPDGGVSFFNDSALQIAPPVEHIEEYARRLGLPEVAGPSDGITHLKESGFIRLQTEEAVALLDVGEIGPSYQPGHAHADTLSFELSLFGRRLIVNSGTSTYAISALRALQRSTRAHSTVSIDGEDSSEVWASFRVARRAHPYGLAVCEPRPGEYVVECSHDGYKRLKGNVVHTRRWSLGARKIDVADTLSGAFARAEANFPLHPERAVKESDILKGWTIAEGDALITISTLGAQAELVETEFYPEFGKIVPNLTLRAISTGPGSTSLSVAW